MKKRTAPATLPQMQIQEISFTRTRRSWLPAAALAAPSIDNSRVVANHAHVRTADAGAGSWIRRARLN